MTSILVVRRGRQATGVEGPWRYSKVDGRPALPSCKFTCNREWTKLTLPISSFSSVLLLPMKHDWRKRRGYHGGVEGQPTASRLDYGVSTQRTRPLLPSTYVTEMKWPSGLNRMHFFQHQTVINGEFYWSTLNREQSLESQTYSFLLSVPPKRSCYVT